MSDTITLPRSVVEQALEAFADERAANNPLDWHHDKVMMALRAALEQQPTTGQSLILGVIGWKNHLPNSGTVVHWTALMPPIGTKLYTHPQPKREPLTDDEHERLMRGRSTLDYARAIERAHNIK